MAFIPNFIFYVIAFLSVYVQVFFLVTFLENRKKMVVRSGEIKLKNYPAVTIIVPVFNEENTVEKSINSILNLNYPKDKIKIFLVNDGSTDGTASVINKFASYPNIKIFHKENGGKYTALNLGLAHLETDFFGGLDADSVVHPEALVRIMGTFEKDPEAMAVAPSIAVHNTSNILQNAQKTEYHMGVFAKRMLGFLGGIHVTPGPLTIFKRRVFDDLGPYRHGHNTEDMEIAYRMQKNHYKIDHCLDAYVYTNTPKTIKKLYKQRLRWIYGFINNTIDYRGLIFRKKYGNFAFFTLPMSLISLLSVSYLFIKVVYVLGSFVYSKIMFSNAVGWSFTTQFFNFDPFFLNFKSFVFLMMLIYALVVFSMIMGKKVIEGKWALSIDMLYFFPVFTLIAPFWLLVAIFNTILKRPPAWR